MRFMILGAGMQGRACAFDMLKNPATTEVLLADSSPKMLAAAKTYLKSPKVKTAAADAGDTARVKKLAAGRDVLVSAVPYFFNLPLAKAAVAAKVNFVDLGGNTAIVRRELALDSQAKKAGVCVLPDNGLGPGMISTIAVHGMEQLDETDEVLIRDGGLPQDPVPPMNYMLTFSEHGLINEYVENATALRGGLRVEVGGLSEVETIDLPAPLGRCEAAHAAGGLSTMAWTYEGKVRFMDNKLIRYPGHIAVINAMRAMGFFDQTPRAFGKHKLSPREMSARLFRETFAKPGGKDLVVIHVTVRGRKDGKRAEVVAFMLDRYDEANRMTAMMRTTGFPVSIVAQMAASRRIPPGAHTVEAGVPAGEFIQEARRRGFDLSWKLRFLDQPVLAG
ncbi:MAG: saccharopine dehydrogenase NADP-binding domain-containing protein [Elusimicrobia bacterium]|nr:saccharopine dehydrogenase NADP-binding domain-containing protein [Elusimicrobiota bacterium]